MTERASQIQAYFDGLISKEAAKDLEAWVAESGENARVFVSAAALHSDIRDALVQDELQRAGAHEADGAGSIMDPNTLAALEELAEKSGEAQLVDITEKIKMEGLLRRREAASRARQRSEPQRTTSHIGGLTAGTSTAVRLLAYSGVAAVIVLAATLMLPGKPEIETRHLIVGPPPVPAEGPGDMLQARLVVTAAARWGGDAMAQVGAPLEARRYTLTNGNIQIKHANGARVTIEAPAVFELHHDKLIHLESGRLVGLCPDKRSRGYTVTTPTGRAVDHGTEFGVSVDDRTTVAVFEGEVALSGQADTQGIYETITLHAGQASRVDAAGRLEHDVLQIKETGIAFIREVPEAINLADVVAGGNGLGLARDAGIDVMTARLTRDYTQALEIDSDDTYRPTPWSDYIDGVFVPGGKGKQAVTSTGHTFSFPPSMMSPYGPIWARRPHLEGDLGEVDSKQNWFNGIPNVESYTQGLGIIGMHSNAGLTVDLNALRRDYSGASLDRFRGVFASALPDKLALQRIRDGELRDTYLSRCHVIIDGEEVDTKLLDLGERHTFDIPLPEDARFLTIAFTDGGDEYWQDWTILSDAQITLKAKGEN